MLYLISSAESLNVEKKLKGEEMSCSYNLTGFLSTRHFSTYLSPTIKESVYYKYDSDCLNPKDTIDK